MQCRVKILSKIDPLHWKRLLPNGDNIVEDCEFVLDRDERHYDWLVVYSDISCSKNGPDRRRGEKLACDPAHTLLVTTEPSNIKVYGSTYVNQFGHVLTSQAEWALPHNHRIFSQSALHWFYGIGKDHVITYDQLRAARPRKSKDISTVCSSKQMRLTLHYRRHRFTQRMKEAFPQLGWFGHGVKRMDDKAEALDDYRYHIAIENFYGEHHWTEKLSDAFLGYTLPFYYGCPNAASYFPEESFIPIDIFDFEASKETIDRAIRDNEYEKRLPYILESRRKVLEDYNLISVVSRIVSRYHSQSRVPKACHDETIYPRKTITRNSYGRTVTTLYEKARMRLINGLGQGLGQAERKRLDGTRIGGRLD